MAEPGEETGAVGVIGGKGGVNRGVDVFLLLVFWVDCEVNSERRQDSPFHQGYTYFNWIRTDRGRTGVLYYSIAGKYRLFVFTNILPLVSFGSIKRVV